MKSMAMAAVLLLCAAAHAQAVPASCSARLLHIEATDWKEDGHPVARMTLQVRPSRGRSWQATIEQAVSEVNPPRVGSVLRVSCDPANPTDLHPMN
jgi:hypothetical protein